MKETSKLVRCIFIGLCMFPVFSCSTASIVNFESIGFRELRNNDFKLESLPNVFFFARIMTATSVEIIFYNFSKDDIFEKFTIKNLSIKDSNGKIIYEKKQIEPETTNLLHNEKNCNYKIFSYVLKKEEVDRLFLKKYKTDYLIIHFEINGKIYSDKLLRVENKYLVTKT